MPVDSQPELGMATWIQLDHATLFSFVAARVGKIDARFNAGNTTIFTRRGIFPDSETGELLGPVLEF